MLDSNSNQGVGDDVFFLFFFYAFNSTDIYVLVFSFPLPPFFSRSFASYLAFTSLLFPYIPFRAFPPSFFSRV